MTRYLYTEAGLDNVVLHGGVTRISCRRCKRKYVSIRNESQMLQVLAMVLLARPGCLRGPELRYLRQIGNLTQGELAKELGSGRYQTISEWEAESSPRRDPGTEILLRLVLLQAFRRMLDVEGNNHLSLSHHERLREFEEAFTVTFAKLLHGTPPRRLALEKEADRPWQSSTPPPSRTPQLLPH